MNIFSVAVLGIIGAVLAITVKQTRPELGILVSLGACIALLLHTFGMLSNILQGFDEIIAKSGLDESYFKLALKICAIAYITEFSASLCRDAGESAIAAKTEFAGKISVLFLTIPIIQNFLSSISDLIDKI